MSYGYQPPPSYAPPPYPGQQAPPGWFRRNRAWFIPTLVVAIVLLGVLFVAGIVGLVFGLLKSSEPYRHSVQVATHDSRVQAKLGTPVKPGWMVSGSVNLNNSSGDANLAIPVTGSVHKGTVYVVAKKSEGQWSYQTLELGVDGESERINLMPESDLPSETK